MFGGNMRRILVGTFLITLICAFGLQQTAAGSPKSQDYRKANKMFAEGKFTDAIALYKGILISPSNDIPPGDVYTRMGDSYFRIGDYQNARESYRGALTKQKPAECAPTQYWIGFCSFLLGKDDEAVSDFLKIPELYPSSGMWVGTAYYWAGRASQRMGKNEQAAGFYRKAGGKGKSTQERFALKKAESVKDQNNNGTSPY
jgi:tetratricopeptide (TPR) repeat protein